MNYVCFLRVIKRAGDVRKAFCIVQFVYFMESRLFRGLSYVFRVSQNSAVANSLTFKKSS